MKKSMWVELDYWSDIGAAVVSLVFAVYAFVAAFAGWSFNWVVWIGCFQAFSLFGIAALRHAADVIEKELARLPTDEGVVGQS